MGKETGYVADTKDQIMSARPLRVCLVAPLPPPYGGIANWTVLVRRYTQMRSDVNLEIIDTAPRWRTIEDFTLWKRAGGGGLKLVLNYGNFLRLLLKSPDVIHLTTSGRLGIVRDIAILATARLAGIPTVYHIRCGRLSQIAQKNTREWRMLARAIGMANAVIAIDPATEATIRQRFPQVMTLQIPNGIDLNELPPSLIPSTLPTVLFLGWVIPAKGMAELVQAWAKLKMEGWRCIVAGPGSETYREELRQNFQPGHLQFLPEQSHEDAMRLLAASDVFVLPSHTEGFPNVIIEAMAMGKTIIATSVGAIPAMLSMECGIIVPPHDAEALGKALRQVCSEEALRKATGARAQLKARTEYAMDKVLEQLMAVWREAAATGSGVER
jgi:glycosyltransferase involved in cell wall biosynthesis